MPLAWVIQLIGIPNGAKLMLQRRRKRSLNPREGKCQTPTRLFFSQITNFFTSCSEFRCQLVLILLPGESTVRTLWSTGKNTTRLIRGNSHTWVKIRKACAMSGMVVWLLQKFAGLADHHHLSPCFKLWSVLGETIFLESSAKDTVHNAFILSVRRIKR